jgi:hypothetical protein
MENEGIKSMSLMRNGTSLTTIDANSCERSRVPMVFTGSESEQSAKFAERSRQVIEKYGTSVSHIHPKPSGY